MATVLAVLALVMRWCHSSQRKQLSAEAQVLALSCLPCFQALSLSLCLCLAWFCWVSQLWVEQSSGASGASVQPSEQAWQRQLAKQRKQRRQRRRLRKPLLPQLQLRQPQRRRHQILAAAVHPLHLLARLLAPVNRAAAP